MNFTPGLPHVPVKILKQKIKRPCRGFVARFAPIPGDAPGLGVLVGQNLPKPPDTIKEDS